MSYHFISNSNVKSVLTIVQIYIQPIILGSIVRGWEFEVEFFGLRWDELVLEDTSRFWTTFASKKLKIIIFIAHLQSRRISLESYLTPTIFNKVEFYYFKRNSWWAFATDFE